VTKDFVEDGFLAVKIANEYLDAAVQQFDADPDIEGYEDDGLFEEQGTIDEYVSMDEHHGRKLDETVPYGVILTEGDQVQAGENPPTVCIIDTGVARLHPDLNKNLLNGINRVSNVDSTSLQWYNDTRGHGTHVSTATLLQLKNPILFSLTKPSHCTFSPSTDFRNNLGNSQQWHWSSRNGKRSIIHGSRIEQ